MPRILIYKILLVANIAISFLLFLFIFLAHLSGMRLVIAILMTLTGIFGALAMRKEIRKYNNTRSE
jgi:hypothetical protein